MNDPSENDSQIPPTDASLTVSRRFSTKVEARLANVSVPRWAVPPIPYLIRQLREWSFARRSYWHEFDRPTDDPLYNIVIPEREKITMPSIWVVEMYPPSYSRQMSANIRRLGWNARSLGNQTPIAERLERSRSTGTTNSTVIAKLVAELSDWHPMSGETKSRLPNEFRSVEVTVVELQNSLTAVVAGFRLSDDAEAILDRELRRIPKPRVQRLERGHSIHSRESVATENVRNARQGMHDTARSWLATRVPGVFASEAHGQLPVLDFILTELAVPFVQERPRESNYLQALGIATDFNMTTSPDLPGVLFSEYAGYQTLEARTRDVFSLSGRFDTLLDEDDPYFNGMGRTMQVVLNRLDEMTPRFLSRLAITSLLDLKFREAAFARDSAHDLHGRRSVRSVKRLRETFLRGSLDTLSIANAVKRLTADLRSYKFYVPEFETVRRPQYQQSGSEAAPLNQLDYLASYQNGEADRLVKEDSDVREVLSVVASLNSSIEGIRVQRWALTLSTIAVIVAGASTLITVGPAAFAMNATELVRQTLGLLGIQ